MIDHASFELHRVELTALCRRMLGASEAEDAVQETFIRAWRGADFEGRASLRSWLHRIARNICLDILEGRKRQARPMGLEAADDPITDESAEQAVLARESVRLAFVAAVQHLPPMQRAVLILREVLRWQAAEVAELLGTSVPSVNSALQRARATLRRGATPTPRSLDAPSAELVAGCVSAFERDDMDALTSVLHEDATGRRRPASEARRARIRRRRPRPAFGRVGGASSALGSRGS
jgi:RNA polymerase sigma-70 factor, ECF subfamily